MGLGWKSSLRHRHGRRHHRQRPRGRLDTHAGDLGQQLPGDAVPLRVGPDQEPGRRVAVDTDRPGGAGRRAGSARPVEAARAGHAHDGPRTAHGPGLRADLAALPRAPGGVRRRVREGVVQADAPRHGADHPLPRPAGAVRAADLAGPRASGLPPAGAGAGRGGPQGEDPRLRTVGLAARLHRVGLGVDVPRHRQARRRQRRPDPPRAAERVGRQRTRQAGAGAAHAGGDPAGVRGAGDRRQAHLARRPDRAGRLRRRREGREGRRLRRRGALHPGAHGRDAGADRRRVVRRARADRGRLPQLPGRRPAEACRAPARRQGEPAHAHRTRDDGARGRPARARRELRRVGSRRVHRPARGR